MRYTTAAFRTRTEALRFCQMVLELGGTLEEPAVRRHRDFGWLVHYVLVQ